MRHHVPGYIERHGLIHCSCLHCGRIAKLRGRYVHFNSADLLMALYAMPEPLASTRAMGKGGTGAHRNMAVLQCRMGVKNARLGQAPCGRLANAVRSRAQGRCRPLARPANRPPGLPPSSAGHGWQGSGSQRARRSPQQSPGARAAAWLRLSPGAGGARCPRRPAGGMGHAGAGKGPGAGTATREAPRGAPGCPRTGTWARCTCRAQPWPTGWPAARSPGLRMQGVGGTRYLWAWPRRSSWLCRCLMGHA